MCEVNENELNQEVGLDEDMEEMLLQDMDKEQLIDVIEQLMSMKEVEINTDDVQGAELNGGEFQAGIDSISFICGQYSALKSVGVDSTSAVDIIMNERNIDYNLEINKMTCISHEKQAKIQQTQAEQNQI